jgi:hypothetical protein
MDAIRDLTSEQSKHKSNPFSSLEKSMSDSRPIQRYGVKTTLVIAWTTHDVSKVTQQLSEFLPFEYHTLS